MDLYLFNPDSDLALGNNSEYYRPPANACRLTHDLALLPAWYAEPGSTVLVPREADARHLDRLSHLLPQGLQAVTYLHAAHCQADGVQPWGWNKAVRRRLADMGIRPTLMPDDARLDLCDDTSGLDAGPGKLPGGLWHQGLCGQGQHGPQQHRRPE